MKQTVFFILFFSLSLPFFSQTGSQPIGLHDIVAKKYAPADEWKNIQACADGEHFTALNSEKTAILKYACKTGKVVDTLFHVDKTRETRLSQIDGYQIDIREFRILAWTNQTPIYRRSWEADVYDYDVRRNFLKPLSDTPGKVMIPTFSPDGRMVAFVRNNNIWIKKFDYDTESQITKDGAFGKILNGTTDWVYEEEFVQTNMLSWSADSRFLAFLKSDETDVPTYSFSVFNGDLYPKPYSYKYPKAGQKNSSAACFVFDTENKTTQKMNVPLDADGYIPAIHFTENIDQLMVMTLNRQQNNFNMYVVNPKSAVAKLVLHDKSEYYIDSDWILSIAFSKNNFAYVSEKDGYAHIYLYSMTGVPEKQLTSGRWDVTSLYGYDETTKTVYYQSAEESPLHRSVYKIDGKGVKTKLSSQIGTNQAQFNPNFTYFIHQFSNISTPDFITICDTKGKQLVVLEDNKQIQNDLSKVRFSEKEFFKFKTGNGDELNGWMIKPTAFQSNKKYPVLMIQYNGPNSQEVRDRFKIDWYHYLAEQGYIVACVDGRGTGARGEQFRKCTYQRLGLLESDDQIATAKYLTTLPYIDQNRIAIWGWSYGGFTTLMAMSRGNGIFNAGIAIAPVTDWKFYDSIYAERFMRTPQENFENYQRYAPLSLVDHLQGNLLLVHGTADDNVHIQNTYYYAEKLVDAGKNFEMQIYSNKNHSLLGTATREHLYNRIISFLRKNN
ncbi:MAG: S9 family peptidase [Candidatus Symbiothrix sp.]|jgi:dipeptidyl-peptidase-4|nr:S9 family peptidase [Candidatus Symbiothrix sp.]